MAAIRAAWHRDHRLADRQRHLWHPSRARGARSRASCNRRSALIFPTGYQANLGMLAGLAGPRDVILMDADSHSSIYDGCRLSGATVVRFRHNDPDDLDRRLVALARAGRLQADRRRGHLQHARRPGAARRVRRDQATGMAPICWSTRPIRSACSASMAAARPRSRASRRDVDLRRRHLQQEPGRGRRLRRVRPPEVRRAALLQPAVHVHGVVLPLERRLGAVRRSGRCGASPSCASGCGRTPARCTMA